MKPCGSRIIYPFTMTSLIDHCETVWIFCTTSQVSPLYVMHAHFHVCIFTHVWRPEIDIVTLVSYPLALHRIYLIQGISLDLKFIDSARLVGWLMSYQDPLASFPTSTGVKVSCHSTFLYCGCWGSKLGSLCLHSRYFAEQAFSPALKVSQSGSNCSYHH